MATYREMTYMVLDSLKVTSDDAFYNEEHVLFLLGRIRSLLLLRKYNAERRYASSPATQSPTEGSYQNYQMLCLDLEESDLLPGACGGQGWLRSTKKIPALLGIGYTMAYPKHSMIGERVTFIPVERMPYVGYNKWLKTIIYVAYGHDGYLYVRSANPQFRYLEGMKLRGIFEDAEAAAKLQCTEDGDPVLCDILDAEFPLEDGLLAQCIEMTVQELRGSLYAPMDKQNNAEDDLAKAAVTTPARDRNE
jgi:hypothetical protein